MRTSACSSFTTRYEETIMSRGMIIGVVAVVAGCGGEVPGDPTWFDDVQPIVQANCARCHGADPSDPKIARFRLDRYVKDDTATFDAYDYALDMGGTAPMVAVAVDQEAPAMPPDYALSDRQREILATWSSRGAKKGTRDNRVPQLELIRAPDAPMVDQELALTIRSWDDDLDGLAVQLWAHDLASADDSTDVHLGPIVGGGQRTITADSGQLASKHRFQIYAVLDDGFSDDPLENRHTVPVIENLYVDHGARGTAPTVTLISPNGGDTLIGSTTITWSASDPDVGDTLNIDLAALRVASDGSTTVAATIATGVANSGSFTWMIPGSLSATDNYKVRVTATDTLGMPPNVRSDASDLAFTIAQPSTTTFGWSDVSGVFTTYCAKCHGDPARTAAINYFCLLEYSGAAADRVSGCAASDQGVFEVKSLVYQRLITLKNMPPAAEPKPSQADLDKVGNWILGGAPKGSGGGPTNMPPTLTWSMPSATQGSGTTVALAWMAADVEGLATGKLEYAHVNGIPSSGCGGTVAMSATWTQIADAKAMATLGGAMMWMDSLTWTVPNPTGAGYYCLRGSVTDIGGTTTVTTNPFGVK
jgi:cytochrome c553